MSTSLTCAIYFSDITATYILYFSVVKNAETFVELANQQIRQIILISRKLFFDIIVDQEWPEVKEFRSSRLDDKRMKIR